MSQPTTSELRSGPTREVPQGFFAGQRKLYFATALLALAVGFFAFNAFQEATVYYLTVDELVNGDVEVGKTVRVSGKLVPESFKREGDGTVARFTLTDGSHTLHAMYNGILPELFFNEQSDIVLEGSVDSNGTFQTKQVVVKCPSKYQALADEQRTGYDQPTLTQ